MNVTSRMVLGSSLAVLLGLLSATARAASYTYTLIAQTGGVFSNLDSSPTINNFGTVAFYGLYTNGDSGIFVGGGGGPVSTIADTLSGSLTGFSSSPSMNDFGSVAFSAGYSAPGCDGQIVPYGGAFVGSNPSNVRGVYVTVTEATICIYPSCPSTYGGGWLNDNGTLVLGLATGSDYCSERTYQIVTGNGGPLTGIYSVTAYLGASSDAINNAGTVAFASSGGCCPPESGPVYTGNGGSLTEIGIPANYGETTPINNAGTVAFLASGGTNIVAGNGGPPITVADTSGAYSNLGSSVSLNDAGTVLFSANLASGASGLFTGLDPVMNQVILTGDPLFGSTVSSISVSQQALNNAGAVAFRAGLTDGREVIVRADPDLRPNPVSLTVTNGVAILTFPTMSNVIYSVQATADLATGTWYTTVGNIPGSGGVTNIFIPVSGFSQQFYRIGPMAVPAFYVAADNAADPAYAGAWTGGSDGGSGFSPWVLTATSPFNSAGDGFLIGSSTNNAFGDSPGIDVKGSSWGLYANNGNYTAAYRALAMSLPVTGWFKVDMDNGLIDTGNSVGFVLRNGDAVNSPADYNTGARFEFLYLGGTASNSYAVVDAAGFNYIGVPFTGTGLHVLFNLGTNDTYALTVSDNASGSTLATRTGTLGGTPNRSIDSVAVYNRNAGSGPSNEAFFNSLQVHWP